MLKFFLVAHLTYENQWVKLHNKKNIFGFFGTPYCIYEIQIFLADGRTNGRTEVFHEALADLKMATDYQYLLNFTNTRLIILPGLLISAYDTWVLKTCQIEKRPKNSVLAKLSDLM